MICSRSGRRVGGWLVVAIAVLAVLGVAVEARAQLTITVTAPTAGSLVDTALPVVVSVSSSGAPVAGVVAEAAGRTLPLVRTTFGPLVSWQGTLDLTGLPRGSYVLTVTARDVEATIQSVQVGFRINHLPQLTVTSPTPGALARPDIRVVASCADDAPGCRLFVHSGSVELASAADTIDTVVSLPTSGDVDRLLISAVDSDGQDAIARLPIYVDTSAFLSLVASFPGRILDIDATRALVLDDFQPVVRLLIVDRATMQARQVFGDTTEAVVQGFLTPRGALFSTRFRSVTLLPTLREWRDGPFGGGALSVLGLVALETESPLQVAGRWAAWIQWHQGFGANSLRLYDVVDGTITVFDSSDHALSASGDLLHTPSGSDDVWRYRAGDGTDVPVLVDASYSGPRTDGTVVVARRSATTLGVATGGADAVLTSRPDLGYHTVGGRVAFVRDGGPGASVAWVREADGTEHQVLSLGHQFRLEALGPNGDVVTVHQPSMFGEAPLGRFLSRPNAPPLRFDTFAGTDSRAVWLDDAWHVLLGPHLLRLGVTASSILSEGATGAFFDTDVSIFNPNPQAVNTRVTFVREDGGRVVQARQMAPLSQVTLHLDTIPGLEATAVSTLVEALDSAPLAVERTMSWDASGYGAHAATAVDGPRRGWLFAEGAQGYFDTFYLLVNDGPRPAQVRIRFLREFGGPVDRQVTVPAGRRVTIWAGGIAELVNQSFAAAVDSSEPIVAERAMYFGGPALWTGGHESQGTPAALSRWFHAEGATGPLFDTFLLLANPNGRAVSVQVVYATGTAFVTRSYDLAPYSRRTIVVEQEDAALASANVSMEIASTGPIVTERAMYWSTVGGAWQEAHDSPGMPAAATRWALAGGLTGGARSAQTYVLVASSANNTQPATLRLRFVDETGNAPIERTYSLAPGQRVSVRANDVLPDARFGVIVESQNGVPVYVEQSTYWNADGVVWAAGTNIVGTPLP